MKQNESPKLKICLVGESFVGKTSLIRRFVYDEFDDKYIVTLGAKVTKKIVKLDGIEGNGPVEVQMLIWDIVGEQSFRKLLQESFFYGTHGIIGACDLTREKTLSELDNWMEIVQRVTDKIPVVFLGNKCDLGGRQVSQDDLDRLASGYENSSTFLTSAKTGGNVEEAFNKLCQTILQDKNET
jgi:small GTP-binding protein